jgi:hypothetical protein
MIMSTISIFKQPVIHKKYFIGDETLYSNGIYFPINILNDEPRIYYNYVTKEYTDIYSSYDYNKLDKIDKVFINNNLFTIKEVINTEGGYIYILDKPIKKIDNEPDEVIWKKYCEELIKYYNEKDINREGNTKKFWWQFWK